jgi:hypothetical protein
MLILWPPNLRLAVACAARSLAAEKHETNRGFETFNLIEIIQSALSETHSGKGTVNHA